MVWTNGGNEQWKQKEGASFSCLSSVTVWKLKFLSAEPAKLLWFCEVFARTLCRIHCLFPSQLFSCNGGFRRKFQVMGKRIKQGSDWCELFEWQEYGWMLKCQPVAVAMTGRSFVARFNRILKAPGAIGRHQGLSIVRTNSHWTNWYFSSWLPYALLKIHLPFNLVHSQ